MERSIIDREAQHQAIELSRCPLGNNSASLGEPVATNYAEYKPKFYALLSHATGTILDTMCETPLPSKRPYHLNTFERLHIDSLTRVQQSFDRFQAEAGSDLITELLLADKRREALEYVPQNVFENLRNGAEASVFWSTHVVKWLGKAAAKLPESQQETALRSSHMQLRKFAELSVDQLALLHSGAMSPHFMRGIVLPPADQAASAKEKPSQPKLALSAEPLQNRLTYSMLQHALISGYDTSTLATIGDFSPSQPTIGCPILLRPKSVQKLWNWQIDNAQARGLILRKPRRRTVGQAIEKQLSRH